MQMVHTMDPAAGVAYSVAVVDDDPRVRTILAMHLGDMARAASFPNLSVLENKTAPGVPMVIVLGPSFAEADARLAEPAGSPEPLVSDLPDPAPPVSDSPASAVDAGEDAVHRHPRRETAGGGGSGDSRCKLP